jgi:membrane peptidoglycan carboxypeptidase
VNRTGAAPAVNRTGAAPAVNRSGAAPAVNRTGAAPAVNRTGAAPAVNRTGAANAVNRSGAAPAVNRTGAAPAVSRTGAAPAVNRTGTTSAATRTSADGTSATRAESRAERREQAAEEGWRRWLEPTAYSAAAAGLYARALEYRRRRRAMLAQLTPGRRLWARTRRIAAVVLSLFVVEPALVLDVGYLCFSVPTPDEASIQQIATINFADSTEMARIVPEEGNRTKVTIDQVPKPVQLAVLAAEDRSFFSNPGFDPIGIARAAFKQLTGGGGGGSTITQQYVKKTLVGDEHSLWRKYKEMVIAVKISRQNRKDQILANYLNAIYFGRGAYGIQSAGQAYFGKNVGDLGVEEGALLAGVIQSPSRWDPAISPQRAVSRWTFVMDGLLSQGWITSAQRSQARFPETKPRPKSSGSTPSDYRGLVLNAIRDELEQKGISEQEFNQEGLKITTTLDPAAEQDAIDSARKALIGQPPNLRGALVSIDPDTGGIKAYYGGDNGAGLDYARVSKQPGSTFKPFVLLAALQQTDPIGLGTKFKGMPFPGLRNDDGADCKVCDIKQAMTISNNVIFHELALRVGPQKVADAARQAGVSAPLTDVNEGIALGNKEITPIDLASAYATIAAGGVYHQPHLVTKVTTSDDRVLYDAVNPQDRRFSTQIARNVTEAMLGVPVRDKLTLDGGRATAAKTGTVQSHVQGQNNDAWIAGFTPSVATAVWIGTDQNSPIKTSDGTPISGATLPGTIWKSFMDDTTKSTSEQSFGAYKPIGVPPAVVGPADGYAAGPAIPATPPPPAALNVPDLPAPSDFDDQSRSGPPVDDVRRPPSTHRECGLLGCKTVQDNG